MSGDTIITDAAHVFGLDPDALCGDSRTQAAAHARQAAYYALRADGWTLMAIGALFRRDHQTVLYGARQAAQRAAADPRYALRLAALLPDRMGVRHAG